MKICDSFTYGFLTVVTMKIIMFLDLRSCSLVKVYLRENYARLLACLLSLLFKSEDVGSMFQRNVGILLPGYIASYVGNSILHFILFFRYVTSKVVLPRSMLIIYHICTWAQSV
jgi:hypothetical protein